jgi:tetratricopeptide (TPR) repeat protein
MLTSMRRACPLGHCSRREARPASGWTREGEVAGANRPISAWTTVHSCCRIRGLGHVIPIGWELRRAGPPVACTASVERPTGQDVLASVCELAAAGHYAGVVAICSEALDHEPFDVALLLQRARAWTELRRPDQAQADLREVLRLDQAHGGAYCMLGQLLASNGKLAAAREAFRRAIEVSGGDATARQQYLDVEARLAARVAGDRAATDRRRSSGWGADPDGVVDGAGDVPRGLDLSSADRWRRDHRPPARLAGPPRPSTVAGRSRPRR